MAFAAIAFVLSSRHKVKRFLYCFIKNGRMTHYDFGEYENAQKFINFMSVFCVCGQHMTVYGFRELSEDRK